MGSATAIGAQPSPDFGPWQMAVDQLRLWGEAVYRFLQWERERILKRDPSPKEQSEHREALKTAMHAAGFRVNPKEWWHYSRLYGWRWPVAESP